MAAATDQLKSYKIIEEVGAGGLGKVYKAIDTRNGRYVAIKVLHKRYQLSRRFLGIFHRELLIVSRFRHKHIVEFIDANYEPPNCYIVSAFVDGLSLYALMKRFGRVPPLVGLSIGIDILQGIDYLHLHDTIHSDLSSPNVLIDKAGRVLVTDFGLAAQEEVEDYKSYMVGTPGYYSPEHISDAAIVPQSDLYCVGLLMFELITGTKAVQPSKDRLEILRQMKKIDFGRVRIADRKLHKAVVKFLKTALHINPSRRFQNAETMMFEIYQILSRYHIRYARYAIRQYLIDKLFAPPASDNPVQEIYYGSAD